MTRITTLPTPFMRPGQVITAASLNQLAAAASRASLQPGQFQNANLAVSAFGARYGETAGTALVLGLIVATVPGMTASVTGTFPDLVATFDHGYAEDAAIILEETVAGWAIPTFGEYDSLVLHPVANISGSDLRGSYADPVPMLGYLRELTVGEDSSEEVATTFVPANWNMASLPGLSAGFQVPHQLGDKKFVLNAAVCGDEEES